MNINLAHIPDKGLELTEDLDPYVLELQTEELTFISPLHVWVNVVRVLNTVSVKVKVKADTLLTCSRCLEEYPSLFAEAYELVYSVKPEEKFLELDGDLRQEIILSYSLKLICKPDCKGLCPKCGKNLNKETCSCG